MYKRIICLLLVIYWIFIIYNFSSQEAIVSNRHSLKATNVVYNNLVNSKLNIISYDKAHYYIRKMGHITEYFILFNLILVLLFSVNIDIKYRYVVGWIFSEVFAIIDEYHQTFVLGRDGNIKDILIDSVGILLGLSFSLLIVHIRNRVNSSQLKNK